MQSYMPDMSGLRGAISGFGNAMVDIAKEKKLERERGDIESLRAGILEDEYGKTPQAATQAPAQPSMQQPADIDPAIQEMNAKIESMLSPRNALVEREGLKGIGIDTPEKQEEALLFADKFDNVSDEELFPLIRQRIEKGVAEGRDMSHTASLLNLPPSEARKEVSEVGDLLKSEKFRRLYAKSPMEAKNMAEFMLYDANQKRRMMETGEKRETDFNIRLRQFEEWKKMAPGAEKDAFGMLIGAIPKSGTTEQILERKKGESNIDVEEYRKKKAVELASQPEIEEAIARAKESGKASGEKGNLLNDMNSQMPVLEDVVDRLRELSKTATYTTTGKAFNEVQKQLGFKPTQGATSRAAYIATVDNEILPLLRQTFGAAFTQKEGESLKATLGNPDSSPEEKQAQLDAFIESKKRQIRALSRSAASPGPSSQPGMAQPAAQPTASNW